MSGQAAPLPATGRRARSRWRVTLTLLSLLTAAPTWGDDSGGSVESGRAIYNFRCYFCHGYSGDARTLASTYMQPQPRNFVSTTPEELPLERMITAIRDGVPGSGMMPFASILAEHEIHDVAAFVREEFILRKAENTRYHIPANGWENHQRYAEAFPFARGEIPMDRPDESLSDTQRRGKALYLNACITCHDWGRVEQDEPVWETRVVSYPRGGFQPGNNPAPGTPPTDAISGASVHARHDLPPTLPEGVGAQIRAGEQLFQQNCAFCHAGDGTGMNWIGRFLQPHPRNLTDPAFMRTQTRESLANTIANGLEGTSMPAWKSVLDAGQIEAILAYIDRAFHPLAPNTP